MGFLQIWHTSGQITTGPKLELRGFEGDSCTITGTRGYDLPRCVYIYILYINIHTHLCKMRCGFMPKI